MSYNAIHYQWEKLCRLAELINEDDKLGNVGELISASLLDQQISALSLHLLQNSLVYVNTLILQHVLNQPDWYDHMTDDDLNGYTPQLCCSWVWRRRALKHKRER